MTVMFTPEERTRLRSDLLEQAAADSRLTGGAITGSFASGHEDRWSDIDLAFGVGEAADMPAVLSDWTARMYGSHGAVDHFDVRAGAWTYRVYLLASTLQVDLAFVPAAEFRALAPTFRLVFGQANDARHIPPPVATDLIGMGWLYALHVRSSIARGKPWQAVHMIAGVRDHALALACLRHGLPAAHGKGIDGLPREVTAPFEDSLARSLDAAELARAFQAAVAGLRREIRAVDPALAARLEPALLALSEIPAESTAGG